jgi:outer membrane protein TolC
VKKRKRSRTRVAGLAAFLAIACTLTGTLHAQTKLTLDEAVRQALESRASLKAESDRVDAARGLRHQAGLRANPEFLFQNENLRPGQTYSRDVDTVTYLIQPIDIGRKRAGRVAVADETVGRTQAEYDLARAQLTNAVRQAYWVARGAQESRDLLQTTVANFQKVVDFHAARFSTGAIAEQDFLRVRLESERLKVTANLATIESTRALMALLKEMGQPSRRDIQLVEPIELSPGFAAMTLDAVRSLRIELRVARAELTEAKAKENLETISARPNLSVFAGYKRTQLPDTTTGVNTAIAGMQITVPVSDRNQGNRETAAAEVRRREQLLAAIQTDVEAEYVSALRNFEMRRDDATTTLEPLRQEALNIQQIANAAYAEGGTDLLRLLDAERARIDADLAWVRGMTDYHLSIAQLEAAEGVN